MSGRSMNWDEIRKDGNWTLFLDRDGVLNRRLPGDYVKHPDELHVLEGIPEAITRLNRVFRRIVIVTNQAGIAKGLMTEDDFGAVMDRLMTAIESQGGKVDAYVHCPHKPADQCECRKPEGGMAVAAQQLFPEIDFSRSVMAGDSASDIEFGKRLGMKTVYIAGDPPGEKVETADEEYGSLAEMGMADSFDSD